ncbi:D-tyrosyl-tRNA(Tyr) deacylase [Nautilia profundicola AmH]|uniref:D-aminoacyl-tRNA deacylase n=1 Tax=Nautilia profundicola (strain ATCC BAA-1463 / DSM 18972 / AmH) TaxID=598659 RepID=DTD_NAUPA|nr:D-aminoacyl-tRNA deacylase [Nautilia profundicola]B9L8Z4.1 RecName: Full=D-aminoacyl-tRNA deacylase; Short=DTD; AltName: Full=Gly-tRNA(Ala) deacylase [Nautilia profundicola AmH]ACM93479.1 D-tyrosyl-tRNA(Tyr) deacylase [Nautilia profundicola AmH]
MKAVLQRVKHSSVSVEGKLINEINEGLNVLIGFEKDDNDEKLKKMAKKIVSLRIFGERFEKSVADIKGEILLIPNFTIPAITKKGTRPNFQNSMQPSTAKEFYDKMVKELNNYIPTKAGVFGAEMQVEITNNGPVTIILEV